MTVSRSGIILLELKMHVLSNQNQQNVNALQNLLKLAVLDFGIVNLQMVMLAMNNIITCYKNDSTDVVPLSFTM